MSEIRVENIIGETGTDAVKFTKGINATGIVTATSFSGSGANLTGIVAGLVGFKHVRNTSTTTLNTTSFTTIFSISYTPQDGANNKVYVFASGQFEQDDANGQPAYAKISCSGQHTTDIVGSEQKVGTDHTDQSNSSICTFLRDTNIANNNAITYNFQARTGNSSSDWRPKTSLSLTVIEVASGIDQT
tara:strand:- start:936 stop:1499 length:564 start_codon:yes stop_codon:yes gene_type:complete